MEGEESALAADTNQEEIGVFCFLAQVVEFGTVGCDLINGSIGRPCVEDLKFKDIERFHI